MKTSSSSLSLSLNDKVNVDNVDKVDRVITTDNVDKIDRVTTTVTMWGTKMKKKYLCQANIDKKFMPYINNTINNNTINDNDNDIIPSSVVNSPNKCMKKSLIDSPKTIIIENIEKINNDGTLTLHPTIGDITLKSDSIAYNSIEAIDRYYIVDDDDKEKNEVPFIEVPQTSASSSPSSGETTVQSIESMDIITPPPLTIPSILSQPQPTPLVTKSSNQTLNSATFWENIESQNHFALYNKKLFNSSLESLACGGDYDMLIKAQDKISTDDDEILGPIITPNIASIDPLQQMSNEDKMNFFYKRLVACVLVPKSKRNEIREFNKTSKIVDVTSLSENYVDPEHIIKVWPVTGQLKATGHNIDNDTIKKIIRKRTQNEILNVGIIRSPDDNMTPSETRSYEDDAEITKEDDEISTLLRSNVQDLKRIETDLNVRLMKLKKIFNTEEVQAETKINKSRRDKEKGLMTKYQKIKNKTRS